MTTETIATVIKMLGTLPDSAQNQVVEHLQNYIADLQDELRWETTFNKTQNQLIQKARLAKQQIADGKARAMNIEDL